LSAYTPDGQLRREVEHRERLSRDEEESKKNAGRARRGSPDNTVEADTAAKKEADAAKKIPEESGRDLQPFPMNNSFRSQPVLSDKLKRTIWEMVMEEGKSVREVSVALSVDMRRVGAVVRLLEVEKEWKRLGKPTAQPYHDAILNMVPQTKWNDEKKHFDAHESINDLPVHRATGQQIFHPTSESRRFTRADAAKVFHEKLLPADDRVPHPQLITLHREQFVENLSPKEMKERALAREEVEVAKQAVLAERKAKKESGIRRVDKGRVEFQITDISVDRIGKDGRGRKGVGWRYGAPLMDRSRGDIRIPTKV